MARLITLLLVILIASVACEPIDQSQTGLTGSSTKLAASRWTSLNTGHVYDLTGFENNVWYYDQLVYSPNGTCVLDIKISMGSDVAGIIEFNGPDKAICRPQGYATSYSIVNNQMILCEPDCDEVWF